MYRILLLLIFTAIDFKLANETTRKSKFCHPLVIANGGASGNRPEHTLEAYALAIKMGADFIETSLVMTKDRHLIAREFNELGLTTDIAEHSEFAKRRRVQHIDGKETNGWFSEDFTLKEIKTLRATERMPSIRPNNTRMDGIYKVPTFEEFIHLVQKMQKSENRLIGIYPEIKLGTHYKAIGLPIEKRAVEILHKNGYKDAQDPVYVQCFENSTLKYFKNNTDLKLIQLIRGTSLAYDNMFTSDGLREIATYAHGVGPEKSAIFAVVDGNRLGNKTSFVDDAHKEVHPYTFRKENAFLSVGYKSNKPTNGADLGNFKGELKKYLETGIDGFFTDNPDVALRIRGTC